MGNNDPWSGAGQNTRHEVRDIFARHQAAREAAGERAPPVERAVNLERLRRELVAEQRPRRALLPRGSDPAVALAAAVGADAARRVARGDRKGPLGETACEPVRRSDLDPRAPVFTCLVQKGIRGEYQGRALVSGYRFRGRVELAGGRAAWCKENPRPLHPDQEEFVVVPLAPACTG